MVHKKPLIVVGVDLAGSPNRPTGICILHGMKAVTQIAHSDDEILNVILQAKPHLIPIDAPLSLPQGRQTIHDRSGKHLRECDQELQRRKNQVLPNYAWSYANVDRTRARTQSYD